jgi:putative transposase
MWTNTTRALYARADLALPNNLTDAEWALEPPPLFGIVEIAVTTW